MLKHQELRDFFLEDLATSGGQYQETQGILKQAAALSCHLGVRAKGNSTCTNSGSLANSSGTPEANSHLPEEPFHLPLAKETDGSL